MSIRKREFYIGSRTSLRQTEMGGGERGITGSKAVGREPSKSFEGSTKFGICLVVFWS